MPEVMKAFQCIGCGKIDGPQNCVGVCQDRRVELVYAAEYAALQKQLDAANAVIARLSAQMREIANTTPRNAAWERSYRALQGRAQRALEVQARYVQKFGV
jgi:hypothetical protein